MPTAIAHRKAQAGAARSNPGLRLVVIATVLVLTLANCSQNTAPTMNLGPGLTPGSRVASFFSPFVYPGEYAEQGWNALVQIAREQHYGVTGYVDTTGGNDDSPSGATALNFRRMLGDSGIIYFVTHGAQGAHMDSVLVEIYRTQRARDSALSRYTSGPHPVFSSGELETCDFSPGKYGGLGICMTSAGVQHYFTSKNAVVFAGACGSMIAKKAWSPAQLFFGYVVTTCPTNVNTDFTKILRRMDGKDYSPQLNGQDRKGEGAFAAAGFTPQLRCAQHGEPCRTTSAYTTVLSPAPTQCDFTVNPPNCRKGRTIVFSPKQQGSGHCPCIGQTQIVFDTVMSTTAQPASAGGCAKIVGQHWLPLGQSGAGSAQLNLDLESDGQPNSTGTLLVYAVQALAGAPPGSGPHFGNQLDGTAVGPLSDFSEPIHCVYQGTA
jgi:hypothetical protein